MSAKGTSIRMVFACAAFLQSDACARGARVAATPQQRTSIAGDSIVAVRQFVQGFYDWYTPIALSGLHFPAYWNVLNNADRFLARELAAAIRDDSVAQVSAPITRVPLNFDPFLDSQDPCGPNEVIDVRRQGDSFRLPIRECHMQRPGPVVEVRSVDGRWRISNVFYDRGDLKSYLCQWAKADLRPERRPTQC